MKRALLLLLPACLSTPPPAASDAGTRDAMPDAGPDAMIDATPETAWTLTAISAGGTHVCAIDDATRLYCWGSNRNGQLGIGNLTTLRSMVPVEVGGIGWTAIAAGSDHTCGIQAGAVSCWGSNAQGEAGDLDGGGGDVAAPEALDSGPPTGWIALAAGVAYTCGLHDDGGGARQIYCWGSDYLEQCGNGAGNGTGPTVTPIAITDDAGAVTDWTTISAGTFHACATRAGGELYCWGPNDRGELGDGTLTPRPAPTRVVASTDDTQQLFTSVAAADMATCAIGTNGGLYCWGTNGYQQLGIVGLVSATDPRRVGADTDWSEIAISYHSVCGRRGGGLWCWGDGQHGEIGNGEWAFQDRPTAVDDILDATRITVGYESVCAALAGGGARCWGDNPNGELGNGETSRKHVPTQILPDGGWTAVAADGNHTCGVHGGVAQCWGWNLDGQLAPPTSEGTPTPTPIAGIGAGVAGEVAVGVVSSCALIDGAPWCWGNNVSGEVGSGATGLIKVPTMIGSGTWTHLTAADHAACALDGTTRKCWGYNSTECALGNGGTAAEVLTPTAADASSWTDVTMGYHFGCGLQTGGVLACWGVDGYGEQGDGATDTTAMTPHVLMAGTVFVEVSAGVSSHACAITDTGDLYCWGRNDYGQTGQTSGTNTFTPTQVAVAGDWTAVAAGIIHTCGVNDGALYCWGSNYEGQLGFDIGNSFVDGPQRVGADADWTAVTAGADHTCGLRGDDLYCWGVNVHGQIGDGTQAHFTPQPVVVP